MGTLVNTATVVIGSVVGMFFKRKISERINNAIVKVMGVCAFLLGITGLLKTMAVVAGGVLSFDGSLMIIVTMALGSIVGEKIDIDAKINNAAKKLEKKLNTSDISKGLVNASLIFCVGAMTIIGCFNDGIRGDSSVLLLKSALDGVTSIFLAASMGVGVLLSAAVVFIIQGSLTFLAFCLKTVVTQTIITAVCMDGYLIVMIIGANMAKAVDIKAANLLPAIVCALIWAGLGVPLI